MATPTIDDQFWFNFSGDIVKNSVSKFNEAANKLYNLTVWIYSIFTGSAILSFKFNDTVAWLIYLTPLPFILIVIAAVSSINAQMPVPIDFDPRVPALIEQAYIQTVTKKMKTLKTAYFLTILGSLLTSIIIFYSFILTKSENKVQMDTTYFITKDNVVQILVSGNLGAELSAKCFVSVKDSVSKKDTIAISHLLKTSQNGDFGVNLSTPIKSENYKITVEWTEGSFTRTLTKMSIKK